MLKTAYHQVRESYGKIAKELFIAVPLIAGVEYAMYLWHVNSMVLSFAVSFSLYMSVQWYFSDNVTRENMLNLGIKMVHKYNMDMAMWLTFIWILCFFEPDKALIHNSYVLTTFSSVEHFGFLAVLLIPVYTFVENVSSPVGYQVRSMLSRVLAAATFYRLALFIISYYGDAAYVKIMHHPSGSLQVVVVMLIIGIVVKMTMGVAKKRLTGDGGQAKGYSYGLQIVSDADVNFAAAHECGHAILFAALGADNIPSDLTVHIKERVDSAGVLASVGHTVRPNAFGPVILTEKIYAEWNMLVLLAGKAAESIIMHSSTLGAVDDNKKWLVTASSYLANHYNGMTYYPEPANRFEQSVNNEALSSFRIEQLRMLHDFLMMNIDVLHAMYETLREKKYLSASELAPFFSRVQFPDGFPSFKTVNVTSTTKD